MDSDRERKNTQSYGGKKQVRNKKNILENVPTSWCCSVHHQILHPGTVEHLTPCCRDFSNYG